MTAKQRPPEPPEELTSRVEDITPELACDWLARNTNNRPLREKHVRQLARQIEDGEWILNGESIKFNSRNELQDGQHRLAAIVMADKTVRSLVVYHAPVTAFETIDTGKRRTLADALALKGEVSCHDLGAAIGLHWKYTHRDFSNGTVVSTHTLLLHFEQHPGLRNAVKVGAGFGKIGITGSAAAVAWYAFQEIDPEYAEIFFAQLKKGTDLKDDDPLYRLRERALHNKNARLKMSTHEMLALIIKAWNLWRVGTPCKVLMWRYRLGEAFPDPQ